MLVLGSVEVGYEKGYDSPKFHGFGQISQIDAGKTFWVSVTFGERTVKLQECK